MTGEETVNTVQEEIRQILEKYIRDRNDSKTSFNIRNDSKTSFNIRNDIDKYLLGILEKLNYKHLPKAEVEIDGSIIAINFLSKDNKRLETFEDLVYYMENGQ